MTSTNEWNAPVYHAVSDPQFGWGLRVLERLELSGAETVLDAGCGSGRLTAELAARLPRGRLIGLDLSENMLRAARETLPTDTPVGLVRGDVARLPFARSIDAVFSTATFHWVLDHERLFAEIFTALRRGGRLVAQCGGGPNIARMKERAAALMRSDDFAPYFDGWRTPWNYATPDDTTARLQAAGFVDVATSLEAAPATFPDARAFETFIATVILRTYLARLPDEARRRTFTRSLTARAAGDDPPFTLDYWRLNISARKP